MGDEQNDYRAVKPYGDLGGWFFLNRKTYRLYRVYTLTITLVGFVLGNWLLFNPTRPADAWPSFWVLFALALYIQYRIVKTGRRRPAHPEQSTKTTRYRAISLWLSQIAGWFLLALAALAIWRDISTRGEVHVYEFTLLLVGLASIVIGFKSRNNGQ
ncbi:MAG TPA: hypothetical protein VG328_15775 [Stellaceae bacterium]|jgi:hypothetical protein|nr:hypothetical protein [Stellaceae bacterium]